MTLNQLEILNAIAKSGSLSKAAKELNLSQPSITIQLRKLETELGTRLMDRLGVGVQPTYMGETMIQYAQEIIRLIDDAKHTIDEHKSLGSGKIMLGASSVPGYSLLPKFLVDFKQENPKLEINLQVANTEQIIGELEKRELDIAVVGHQTNLDKKFISQKLWEDKLCLILSPNNPLCKEEKITLDAISRQGFILNEQGSYNRVLIEQSFSENELDINVIMSIMSPEGIVRAVSANMGISFISETIVSPYLRAGLIVKREIPELNIISQYDLVYLRDKFLSPSATNFISTLKNYVLVKDDDNQEVIHTA